MNPQFAVVDAPSILGLRPTGVELLPEALKQAGLLEGLGAEYVGRLAPPPYSQERDKATRLLNPDAIRDYSRQLADAVVRVRQRGRLPVVLGGDCSILIGALLGLRRLGRHGLFFLDGHADFYQPEASPTGEVADMDLALVSGRGPDVLSNIEGLRPLVQDRDVVVFGYRDAAEAEAYGSQDVRATGMHVLDLEDVRALGIGEATSKALGGLLKRGVAGFWIHLDADVVDDVVMPAVDYRLEGGLSFRELSDVLRALVASGRAVGLSITIFNPRLDPDGSIARGFVMSVVTGLKSASK